MKINTITYRRREWGDELEDYNLEITLTTDKAISSVSFSNGEAEDMTLGRDLSDAYSIAKLLQLAYQAGKDGEELIIEESTEDEE